jgi:Arc/MetJ-type ribon-helix-helix transcriptional regulator
VELLSSAPLVAGGFDGDGTVDVPVVTPGAVFEAAFVVRSIGAIAIAPTSSVLNTAPLHPYTIYMDGVQMANTVVPLREKASETEKITVNIGYVDLGRIDLLVQESFYSNRTDFIRTAIRNQLATHTEAVSQSLMRRTLEIGMRDYSRADLEAVKAANQKLQIKVLGLARIASDVSPALALATIESITVLGALQAGPEVKAALAERIR